MLIFERLRLLLRTVVKYLLCLHRSEGVVKDSVVCVKTVARRVCSDTLDLDTRGVSVGDRQGAGGGADGRTSHSHTVLHSIVFNGAQT